ncbi:MAG: hypothetical protein J6W55_05580, partial [Acidaminococcaceae bacterium]|nr:hypothetical protein [Acidaminococcaceae bacterium]
LERAENSGESLQEAKGLSTAPQQDMFGGAAETGTQGHLNQDIWNEGTFPESPGPVGKSLGMHPLSRDGGSRPRQEIWKRPDKTYGEEAPKEPVFSLGEARRLIHGQTPLQAENTVAMQLAGQDTLETIWPIGQVDKTFIIAQSEDTLYLIDQHAAHERILYDRLVLTHNDIPAQQLLIPLYVTLQTEEVELLEQHHDAFYKLGVDITTAGENTVRIASLPSDIRNEDAEDFIREIAQYLREHRTPEASELRQDVLHMTACRAAIKAGEVLNTRQMRQLIIDLCNTTHPFTCPHGRPCMIAVSSDELYKLFKRTGFDLPGKNAPYDK